VAASGLRGDYSEAAADGTVPQLWNRYSRDDHEVWRSLLGRQTALVQRHATPEFLEGLERLKLQPNAIPDFARINLLLAQATGWRVVAVPGLIHDQQFFAHLAQCCFPVTVWIRRPDELDYLAEPDLFHDFFGHVPMLLNPVFARFVQAYGAAGPKAVSHNAVHLLARLYWYTVEFGLIRAGIAWKVYGAGILSSAGEITYSVDSPRPHRLVFDLERIMRTNYMIDEFQKCYFVLDDLQQLFRAGYATDFADLYRRLADQEAIAPQSLLPTDQVLPQPVGAG
jgi:phenylalanine-4-hydroxylase